MEQVDTTVATRPKPNRRRVTIAMSLNRELVKQIDDFARETVMTRSRAWERIALEWITRQMMEAAE